MQLEAKLDNNSYEESQLILIKIPVTQLSYYNSSREFDRVDGQVEMNGIQYKFVKRRLYNDSLELYCIPNHTAMALREAKNNIFKLVSDLQSNTSEKKSGAHPDISKTFPIDDYTISDALAGVDPHRIIMKREFHYAEALSSLYQFIVEHPPDVAA